MARANSVIVGIEEIAVILAVKGICRNMWHQKKTLPTTMKHERCAIWPGWHRALTAPAYPQGTREQSGPVSCAEYQGSTDAKTRAWCPPPPGEETPKTGWKNCGQDGVMRAPNTPGRPRQKMKASQSLHVRSFPCKKKTTANIGMGFMWTGDR